VSHARPFLKWAGGKQPFLRRFGDRIPAFRGQYIEPFLGSGAVLFHVMRLQSRPCPARVGDTNQQLIKTFIAVRDEPEVVYQRLEALQAGYGAATDKARFYYEMRNTYNAMLPRVDAATFIFLNRTCWNGLYRLNQVSKFNVPFGAPKNERVIPIEDDLLNASAALTQVQLRATTWENTVAFAEPGDFVFLDPPYYSDVLRDDLKYQTRPFDLRQHRRLARTLVQLAERGIQFMLTNSGEEEMVELYQSHGLRLDRVQVPRPINSKTDQRSPVPEVIITPPGP